MAKRKSLNRRLSRYSRHSVGSAILDPNTDILGDEHPYWWKNLENNTIARPSTDSNVLNQTSRHLDSNSLIETSKAEDGWWKALETTNTPKFSTITKHYSKKETTNNIVSTSESEEESGIAKRKRSLRSEVREVQGNAFLNVLNDSETMTVTEPAGKPRREHSMNESQSTDNILKLKPRIFRKNYKKQNKNIFDDILQEGKLETPTKRKSSRMSMVDESQTLTEPRLPATTEFPIVDRPRLSQSFLSTENEHDLSHFLIPKAQSTLLENSTSTHDSNKGSNISDAETVVLKPKSRFLRRHNRNVKENAFKNILAEEKTDSETETDRSTLVNKNAAIEVKTSKKSLKSSTDNLFDIQQSVVRPVVDKRETDDAKGIKELQNVKGPIELNVLNEASVASSSTSNTSQNLIGVPKSKTKFLRRPRKSSKKNLFQNILLEDDNIDGSSASRSEIRNRSTEENLVSENVTLSRKTRERRAVSEEVDDSSGNLRPKQLTIFSEDNVETIENSGKKTSELQRNDYDDNAKVSETVTNASRRSKQSVDLHLPSVLSKTCTVSLRESIDKENIGHVDTEATLSDDSKHKFTNESNILSNMAIKVGNVRSLRETISSNEDERAILEEHKNTWRSSGVRLSTPVSDDSNHSIVPAAINTEQNVMENTTDDRSGKVSKSQKRSTLRILSDSEAEELENILKRQSRNSSRSQEQSVSSMMCEVEPNEIEKATNEQNRHVDRSEKWTTSRTASDADTNEVDNIPRRQSRNSNKLQEQSVSATANEVVQSEIEHTWRGRSRSLSGSQKRLNLSEVPDSQETDIRSTPKRQSRNPRRSQKGSTFLDANESEAEEVENIEKRRSRNSSKSHRQSVPHIANEIEEDVNDGPGNKRGSDVSKSQKRSTLRIVSDSEAEELENIESRRSKNSSKLHGQSVPPIANEIAEDVSDSLANKGGSDVSKSRKRSTLRIVSDSKAEELENISKRQSRNSNRSQKQLVSFTMSEVEPKEIESATNQQNRHADRSGRWTTLRTASDGDTNEVDNTSGRQTRNSNKLQEQSVSATANEIVQSEIENTWRGRSRSLSGAQKRSNLSGVPDSQETDIRSTPKRLSKNPRRSQKGSTFLDAIESEAEEVENIESRRSKNSSKSHGRSVPPIANEIAEDVSDSLANKRGSDVSKSRKQPISRIASDTEPEELESIRKGQKTNASKSKKESVSSVVSGVEPNEIEKATNEQNRHADRSEKRTTLRTASDADTNEVDNIPRRQTRNSNMLQEQSVSATANEIVQSEIENTWKGRSRSLSGAQKRSNLSGVPDSQETDIRSTPKRLSRNPRRSQKGSTFLDTIDSEAEEVENIESRRSKNSSKSHGQSVPPIANEIAEDVSDSLANKRGSDVSKSWKRSISRTASDTEIEELESIRKGQKTNASKSKKESVSSVVSGVEPNEIEKATNEQNKHADRSEKRTTLRTASDADTNEVDNIPRRQTRNLNKEQLVSATANEIVQSEIEHTWRGRSRSLSESGKRSDLPSVTESQETRIRSTPKGQTRNLSRSQKQSTFLDAIESETEEVESISKRRSRNLNRSVKRSVSSTMNAVELNKIENDPKRQSKNSSALKNWSTIFDAIESETEEFGQTGYLSGSKEPSSLRVVRKSEQVRTPPKRQSELLSRSRKRSFSFTVTEVDPVQTQNTMKRQSEKISSGEEFILPVTGESSLSKVQDDLNTSNESLSGSSRSQIVTKKMNTMDRLEKRFSFDANVASNKGDENISNVGKENVIKDVEKESVSNESRNKEVANEVKDSNEDTRTSGRTFERGIPKNYKKTSNEVRNFPAPMKISTNRKTGATKGQRNIEDFFKTDTIISASQAFTDKEKLEEIKRKLDDLKKREMENMKATQNNREDKLLPVKMKSRNAGKSSKSKSQEQPARKVHKAFLVNGQVYKAPRLPRPKVWITNRFYNYLWKRMEPKYDLETRVVSEKFVHRLSDLTTFIMKQKSYLHYKVELLALMREMARLGIIRTRNDFYNFCHDFFPYELRFRMVPMLLPGNKSNIPYDADKLHEPILDE